ncbi:MAG: hypothetical protein ABFS56_14940 [Pseudomonadota bacterium]
MTLEFPKPKKGKETYYFSINLIALLKHLENQSNEYRAKVDSMGA